MDCRVGVDVVLIMTHPHCIVNDKDSSLTHGVDIVFKHRYDFNRYALLATLLLTTEVLVVSNRGYSSSCDMIGFESVQVLGFTCSLNT